MLEDLADGLIDQICGALEKLKEDIDTKKFLSRDDKYFIDNEEVDFAYFQEMLRIRKIEAERNNAIQACIDEIRREG
jgi:hypothetical protein